jgi:hypothetical protein
MAVLAAAIEDAEGFKITRMPISPSELFALRERFAAGGGTEGGGTEEST